jgi:hypothetical protein
VISPARSSTRRCLETAGPLIANGAESSFTVASPAARRARIARRTSDPGDRRRVLVEMTPAARAANEELSRPLVEAATEQMLRYSEAELALLREYHRSSRELTEAHAERVRSLLSERAQEGEAAS